MLVVGLTGSIGMGKSTVAGFLRELGLAVFDADAEVHKLYEGSAVEPIERVFPGTTRMGKIDRKKLALKLQSHPEDFARLESIVHPLVRASERNFLWSEQARGAEIAVLEIPLLFETKQDQKVDVIILGSAPADVQRRRVMERPGMTEEKLNMLLGRQLSDVEKRKRADFIVDTSGTFEETRAQVAKIIAKLRDRKGTVLERYWT